MTLENVKNVVLVLSGKGGVGKSTVATQLALTLAHQGHAVGILDIDLTGPSVPRLLGLETRKVVQSESGWVPVYTEPLIADNSTSVTDTDTNMNALNTHSMDSSRIKVMSIAFLLSNPTDPIIWRGPKKTAMISQFIKDVLWGTLDYLIIDTPPGTSDEHISIVEELKGTRTSAVLVTTPQKVATADVRKELDFCKKVFVPILGIVENMSGYVCPHCSECTNIFSKGGGKVLADEFGVAFLGSVPIDGTFTRRIEVGIHEIQETNNESKENYADRFMGSALKHVFKEISQNVIRETQKNTLLL